MTETPSPEATDGSEENRSMLSSSAVMAAGTMVSRMSGFVRSMLLAAALGNMLHADVFTIANTVPNMLYILLAGGIFNAVLVPQLVRAMKHDADGGEAYTNRVITLAATFLGLVTILLVAAAPWVMQVFLTSEWNGPDRAAQRASIIDFARFCLPQVFFYGMFVLVGQVLNARHRFGPMMWAPIANNVISVGVLVVYLIWFGPASGSELHGGYSGGQEALLGLGSTLGIAVQFLILLPYLRAAGFRFSPRFDWRGVGLGHTLRLGMWTVLFVIVNQIAYTIVVRLASSGPAGSTDGTGYTVYSSAFLLVMVPHSIVTVSLATAMLPRLSAYAAEHDHAGLARSLASGIRSALALIVPFVFLLPVIASEVSQAAWGYGAASDSWQNYAPSLALFAPGLLMFSVHYLVLRGFYALERQRTVFVIQCAVAATNIAMALLLVPRASAAETSPALVLAYAVSYLVGAAISAAVLRHVLGGLEGARMIRFGVRLLIATAISTAAAYGVVRASHALFGEAGNGRSVVAAALVAFVALLVDGAVFLLLARLLRIREVSEVMNLVTGRLVGGKR